jgi:pilus assembly protein CpaB
MQIAASRRQSPLSGMQGNRKAIMAAAILGLLAAYLSWNFVQRAGQTSRSVGLVPVIVASQDVPVRTQITPAMLTVKQVPADARHEKAFTGLEQLDGKVTNLPISAGEQVLSTKFFARKEDSGLAFRIAPGKRAVSVNVNEVISTGGLIVPGDFVDIIAVFLNSNTGSASAGQGTASTESAGMVLQNIEVLAIAQSIQTVGADPTGAAAVAGNVTGSRADTRQEAVARPGARTATLAVTPEEAQKLILAEERGKIRLALRGLEDHESVGVPATRLSQVRGS